MNRPALITGATGFIGRALTEALTVRGQPVIALSRACGDIRSAATFDRFRGEGVGVVFHLAARSFVPDSWSEPADFFDVNVQGAAQALEFCRTTGARMVYLSAYLYGAPERLPIPEDAPIRPNNPYAQSKHLAEQLCEFYVRHYAARVCVLRPFNVYGPGQSAKFLIPSILGQIAALSAPEAEAAAGKAIEMLDLAPRRDLVFLSDVVEAMLAADAWLAADGGLAAGQSGPSYGLYNVGSGVSLSVGEIVAAIQRVAGTAFEVRSRNEIRVNELSDVVADIAKARRDLGWSPRTSFPEGIKACLTRP